MTTALHWRLRQGQLSAASVRLGAFAAAGMALFYAVVVWGASGSWIHLRQQVSQDWPYLALIIAGFGIQVALLSELRRRHRLNAAARTTGRIGASASTTGMVACCAHHLADLIPLLGLTGVAAFLTDYRVAFMTLGIGVNALAVVLAARRLHAIDNNPSVVAPRLR